MLQSYSLVHLEAAMELTGRRMTWICSYVLLQILFFSSYATSRSIVKTLPGFDGDLPFKLETGYVGVGEMDDVQLFYYFVESQREPSRDPLLVWLTGGPGCSSFSPFFYANGPLSFDYIFSERGLPTLHLNSDTWTKRLNILYIDAPVGTGFSYSKSYEGYYSDDQKTVANLYNFLQKWLIDHPEFAENHLYLGGGSYSGILIPVTVQKIYDANEAGHKPHFNIKGYVLSSPKSDSYLDANSKVPTAHRLTLISDELYKLLRGINTLQVLEPVCAKGSLKADKVDWDQRILMSTPNYFLHSLPRNSALWCRDYELLLAEIWANDPSVREALYVREGTKGNWQMCNSSLAYTKNILSTIDYHRNLSRTNLRSLIYCADLDMSIPHIATQEMIRSLNLTLDDSWRAWFVDAQVAGYTERYKNNDFYMTYSSVKGAGHVAEEYKPKEVDAMIDRWLAYYPL
ncbi:serine carboxypeptidase-like 13 isoform X4 [Quercus robur]|uniref:serine carboxypeptidase-like 13 isoform X4 n=1 Tax=Quercus robur TaxID=38942 RepID=UPI0021610CA2|nr:serine carboxypeptidase-like 13 isoform X4 [Quercus robur]